MAKIIIAVIPADQDARLKAKYPNPPPDAKPDEKVVVVSDPSKVVETIKAQPEPPVVVSVTNFFSESVQQEVKKAVEAGAPGVPVLLVPQGLDDEQVYEFLKAEKAKHS
ncbi:hypothetical protein BY996DRAFT_4585636 [Phakopsora pachyrhizi]